MRSKIGPWERSELFITRWRSFARCAVRGSVGRAMGRIENHDGKAWRARAEECRAIADTFENPETRVKMYDVADEYERMAERVERRAQEAADAAGGTSGRSGAGDFGTSP